MKKKLSFWESLEMYLRKVAGRSPLSWSAWGIGLILVVLATSLKYSRDSVVGARDTKEVVEIAARRGDYQTAREILNHLTNEPLNYLEDLVYPERKVQARIVELEHKLEIYPENRELYLAIAELYRQLGNEGKAQEYSERARILDPND